MIMDTQRKRKARKANGKTYGGEKSPPVRFAVVEVAARKVVARALHQSEAESFAEGWAKRHGETALVPEPVEWPTDEELFTVPDSPVIIARKLEVKSGLEVSHEPMTRADDDINGESYGHLYRVRFPEPYDCDYHDHKDMWLDDRQDESLDAQLVAELRRVSAMYSDLADELEGG